MLNEKLKRKRKKLEKCKRRRDNRKERLKFEKKLSKKGGGREILRKVKMDFWIVGKVVGIYKGEKEEKRWYFWF